MTNIFSRRTASAMLVLLGLGASTLLTSCFDKGEKEACTPKGGACDTAATVEDLSQTTGCGLALHLADGTYVVPTGATWTNFHPKAGDKVLVGYTTKKNCGTQKTCAAGPLVELGCISINTATTTTTGAN
jgi:hypothetical protein